MTGRRRRARSRGALLATALAAASCVAPQAEGDVHTAPTHVDEVSVPAPLGTAELTTAAELPDPRTEVAGGVLGRRIVVLGGLRADGTASDRVDAYDPATDTWEPLPDLPEPLHHAAVVHHRGRLLVIGGYAVEDGAWAPRAETYSLGVGDTDWSAGLPLPEPRGALAGASTGDAVWVAGGVGPDGLSGATFTLRDDVTGWERGPQLNTPREHLAVVSADDQLHVIAGRTGGLATNLADVEVLDRARDRFVVSGRLDTARGGIGGAGVDGAPCVAGGEEPNGTIATVECLGPEGWQVVASLDVPRHGLAVIVADGALHVVGGGPEPGLTVSGAHEVVRFVR